MAPGKLCALCAVCCALTPAGLQPPEGQRQAKPSDLDALLQGMRRSAEDPGAQVEACARIRPLVSLTDEEQKRIKSSRRQRALVRQGGDLLILRAMRSFPRDMALQRECMATLAAAAQWNAEVFETLGNHGAVETMAAGILGFPEDQEEMLGSVSLLGSLMDFIPEPRAVRNLERVAKTGVTEAVLKGMMEHPDNGELVLQGLCFFSNACRLASLKDKMIAAGYLERSPRIMRTVGRDVGGIGGEVIWVNDACFMSAAEHRNRLADAGYLDSAVATLSDANAGWRVDVLSSFRTFNNALHSFELLARRNETHRALLLQAGAEKEIRAGLQNGLADSKAACACLAALLPRGGLPGECPNA